MNSFWIFRNKIIIINKKMIYKKKDKYLINGNR